MKTRTLKIHLELPASPEALLDGLDGGTLSADPDVKRLDREFQTAQARHEEAHASLRRLNEEVESLSDAVAKGEAQPERLDAALLQLRRASMLTEPTERHLSEARGRLDKARVVAKERFAAMVQQRIDALLIGDQALVVAMDLIDGHLGELAHRLFQVCGNPNSSSGQFDQRGLTGGMPERMKQLISAANR